MTRLLASCDRRQADGRRDYAIVLLLARLGLRACEVAALLLDDADWYHGEIVVRGKADRHERLPLPADVGAAVAAYLRRGRPQAPASERALFLRLAAPSGPLTPGAVKMVVRHAAARAGLPAFGPHQLRHRAATATLRRGGATARGRGVAAAPDPGGDRFVCQGRARRAAGTGPAVAGRWRSSELRIALRDYLALRRALGYRLKQTEWLLGGFVSYLEEHGELQSPPRWRLPGRPGRPAQTRGGGTRGWARSAASPAIWCPSTRGPRCPQPTCWPRPITG